MTIESPRQRQVTEEQAANFERSLTTLRSAAEGLELTVLQKAEIEAQQSVLDELREEMRIYDALPVGCRAKPGPFDCYANAEPDEPMFILLGRDPSASTLVRLWADARAQAGEDPAKVAEARERARALEFWAIKKGKLRRVEGARHVIGQAIANPQQNHKARFACIICKAEHCKEHRMQEVSFCVCCFATEHGGSWGGEVVGDAGFCSNCCANGSAVKMPVWAAQSIREQASWVGRRYYPVEEDIEQYNELCMLRNMLPDPPGRKARLTDPEGHPGTWWVEQELAEGKTIAVMVDADSEAEALAKARPSLPHPPAGPTPIPTIGIKHTSHGPG